MFLWVRGGVVEGGRRDDDLRRWWGLLSEYLVDLHAARKVDFAVRVTAG
jgi:hypothetical protein